MKTVKVYTAGKMSGLTFAEQIRWRNELITALSHFECDVKFSIVNPPMYYNPEHTDPSMEGEAMEWDLNQIRDSNIVVVNLDNIETSIGTNYELGFINAMNSFGNKHIYVIGFGRDISELHPWVRLSLSHYEKDVESVAMYIRNYLLV